MDYFQSVVTDYLRADRTVFVNAECTIQLELGAVPAKGRHWYCDAVAVNFSESTAYLCEVTYSSTLHALVNRLQAWHKYWPLVCVAIRRDCCLPSNWQIRPWVFIPQKSCEVFTKRMNALYKDESDVNMMRMERPKVTCLEDVTPWNYPYDRTPKTIVREAHNPSLHALGVGLREGPRSGKEDHMQTSAPCGEALA